MPHYIYYSSTIFAIYLILSNVPTATSIMTLLLIVTIVKVAARVAATAYSYQLVLKWLDEESMTSSR